MYAIINKFHFHFILVYDIWSHYVNGEIISVANILVSDIKR